MPIDPPLKLETDDERALYRTVLAALLPTVSTLEARELAMSEVRAYRERCAPVRAVDVEALRRLARDMRAWSADVAGNNEILAAALAEDAGRIAQAIGDQEPAPARLGCTVPEAMRDRRAAGESVESLARDFGWDAEDVRAVTKAAREDWKDAAERNRADAVKHQREAADLRAALSVARECREKAEATVATLRAELSRVYSKSRREAEDGSSFTCTRCCMGTPASRGSGGDWSEGICDACWCDVASLMGEDGAPEPGKMTRETEAELDAVRARLDALTRAVDGVRKELDGAADNMEFIDGGDMASWSDRLRFAVDAAKGETPLRSDARFLTLAEAAASLLEDVEAKLERVTAETQREAYEYVRARLVAALDEAKASVKAELGLDDTHEGGDGPRGGRFTGKACEPRCDEDGQVRLRDFTYPCPEHGSAS